MCLDDPPRYWQTQAVSVAGVIGVEPVEEVGKGSPSIPGPPSATTSLSDTRNEFRHGEWLDEVVVAANLKAVDLVFHRNLRSTAPRS